MIPWLEAHTPFPDVSEALTTDAPGLLAAGADLSPQRLLQAYRNGIFPWFSEGQPILWWSTDPRMVLYTDHFKVSDSLKKTLRKIERSRIEGGPWVVRFDSAFESVMRACAAPRKDGPGTYGVCIGRMFYGESMFARVSDASKVALAYLVAFLRSHGVGMLDCQQETGHLASLGAFPIPRRVFLDHLRHAIAEPAIGPWQVTSPLTT
jgi:leucyl/phenylalanyl-tRNA--protein transferase